MEHPVVDSHVHLLPGRLGEKVRAFFELGGVEGLVYPNDHEVVCARLAVDGIDAVWTLPYAHKPGVSEGLNRSTLDLAAREWPLEVIAGCTAHPGDDDPAGVVARAIDEGARVLKLHCSVGGFDADDPRLDPVWAVVSERRVPVVVHAGHAPTGRTGAAELEPVRRVAERWQQARLVIAHCAYPAVDAALELVEAHEHVHADLTPVVEDAVLPDPERITTSADKLLHGSDAPNTCHDSGTLLRRLRQLPIEPGAVAAITGGNATRLVADVDA